MKFSYTRVYVCCCCCCCCSALSSGTLSLEIVKNTYISKITLLFVVKCHFFLLSVQICYRAQQAIFFFLCHSLRFEWNRTSMVCCVRFTFSTSFFSSNHAHSLALSITLIEEQPSNRTNESARNEIHRSPCVIYTFEIESTTFRNLSAFDCFACHFQKRKQFPQHEHKIKWIIILE